MSATKWTPGKWFVRKRVQLGEVADCFVAAPSYQGNAYDSEILGDDEYRDCDFDGDGIERKLADCHLIAAAPSMYAELEQVLEWAFVERKPLRAQEIESIKRLLASARGESA